MFLNINRIFALVLISRCSKCATNMKFASLQKFQIIQYSFSKMLNGMNSIFHKTQSYFLCHNWIRRKNDSGYHLKSCKKFLKQCFVFQFVDLSSAVAMSFSEPDAEKPVSVTPKSVPTLKAAPTLIQGPLTKTVGGTSLIARTTADNLGVNSGATTLMVLTTSAMANHNGGLSITTSNAGTLSVKTASAAGGIGGAKTIVVMPVSNSYAAGDGATAKRFKIE